jgi:uncharacterized CHY-type Zn-finger protein
VLLIVLCDSLQLQLQIALTIVVYVVAALPFVFKPFVRFCFERRLKAMEEEADGDLFDDELAGEEDSSGDDEDIDDPVDYGTEDSDALSSPPQEEEAIIDRRRSIMAVMADSTLTEQEKRLRIHAIMNAAAAGAAGAISGFGHASSTEAEMPDVGAGATCVHYERNCSIVAPCCNRVFGCRICHDELSPAGHPPVNRYLIREAVCKRCNTRQRVSYVGDTLLFRSCSHLATVAH